MITVEIKKMTQQMGIKDKIRLLMSDHNLRCDTHHEKWRLTSQEKQNIFDSIHKEKKSAILNDVLDRYNLSLLLMFEVRFAYENFRLKQISYFMMAMITHTVSEAKDIIGQIIHDLVTSQIKGRAKADKRFDELYLQYTNKAGSYIKEYSCLMLTDDRKIYEANPHIHEVISATVESIRKYRRHKYMIDYLIQTSEVNLTEGSTAKEISTQEEEISNFISHAKLYTEIYKKLQENGFLHITNPLEEQFFEIAKDIEKASELPEKDKQEAEILTDELLGNMSKIIFK